jgi:hypothetical protein
MEQTPKMLKFIGDLLEKKIASQEDVVRISKQFGITPNDDLLGLPKEKAIDLIHELLMLPDWNIK